MRRQGFQPRLKRLWEFRDFKLAGRVEEALIAEMPSLDNSKGSAVTACVCQRVGHKGSLKLAVDGMACDGTQSRSEYLAYFHRTEARLALKHRGDDDQVH
jgi:hypothetical protein